MYPRCVNGWDAMFWNPEDDCPVVYVDGVCANEGKANAKAGWGFSFGRGKSGSRGGVVSGPQNAQRARLFGAIEALQWGINLLHDDKISIISKDDNLMTEVYNYDKRTTGNEDLWRKIDFLMKKIEASFERMFVDEQDEDDDYFKAVTGRAREAAGLTRSGPSGITQNSDVVEKVHISAKTIDDQNMRAEWTLNYGGNDPRNKSGIIHSELALQKADLTALQKVLENALAASTRKVSITTDSKYLLMVQNFRHRWKAIGWTTLNGAELLNKKMLVLVDDLIVKFEVQKPSESGSLHHLDAFSRKLDDVVDINGQYLPRLNKY
uniref:ribonuclease H n=1 Tax=Caenorhabditis japonica TaxID=281687 RepID=A0A8R1I0K8_CAEJA